MEGDLMMFGGIKVLVSPLVEPQPVLRVSDRCPMTDEGRAQMNQWLLDMFGKRDVAYMISDHTMVINEEMKRLILEGTENVLGVDNRNKGVASPPPNKMPKFGFEFNPFGVCAAYNLGP